MKYLFSLIIFIVGVNTFAQNEKRSQLSLSYSLGADDFISSQDNLPGAPSYHGKNYFNVGLDYSYGLTRHWELMTGILYSKSELELRPNASPSGDNNKPRLLDIELISVPLLAKYRFLKYFFVNGGAYINLGGLNNEVDQAGIGLGAGLGAEYTFSNQINIFINPYFQWNGILPKEDFQLLNQGVKVGVGYKF